MPLTLSPEAATATQQQSKPWLFCVCASSHCPPARSQSPGRAARPAEPQKRARVLDGNRRSRVHSTGRKETRDQSAQGHNPNTCGQRPGQNTDCRDSAGPRQRRHTTQSRAVPRSVALSAQHPHGSWGPKARSMSGAGCHPPHSSDTEPALGLSTSWGSLQATAPRPPLLPFPVRLKTAPRLQPTWKGLTNKRGSLALHTEPPPLL